MHALSLSQVMRKSHEAREKLLRLGIFRQVDVLIDTCQGTCGVVSLGCPVPLILRDPKSDLCVQAQTAPEIHQADGAWLLAGSGECRCACQAKGRGQTLKIFSSEPLDDTRGPRRVLEEGARRRSGSPSGRPNGLSQTPFECVLGKEGSTGRHLQFLLICGLLWDSVWGWSHSSAF